MRKISLIICLILILAGCSDNKKKPNTIKMVDYTSVPLVEGTLNGKKAYFILDTGASISVLDETQTSRYGYAKGEELEFGIAGYGGNDYVIHRGYNYTIYLDSIPMTSEFLVKDIKSISEALRNKTGIKPVGIIGNNNIARSRLVINYGTGEVTRFIK